MYRVYVIKVYICIYFFATSCVLYIRRRLPHKLNANSIRGLCVRLRIYVYYTVVKGSYYRNANIYIFLWTCVLSCFVMLLSYVELCFIVLMNLWMCSKTRFELQNNDDVGKNLCANFRGKQIKLIQLSGSIKTPIKTLIITSKWLKGRFNRIFDILTNYRTIKIKNEIFYSRNVANVISFWSNLKLPETK